MANDSPNYDQIAFDMAFTHLAQQGKRAEDDSATCMFRAPDGCKCAIGSMIGDEEYEASMESETVYHARIYSAVESGVGGKPGHLLLLDLQRCHDRENETHWRQEARAIAKTHDLSTTTIDKLDWSACEATG